jgi:uncharacterized protein
MLCPSCKTANLVMSERSGVEIDYCPDCRGVWLDRGELDKIIDRVSAEQVQPTRAQPERNFNERASSPPPSDYAPRHDTPRYDQHQGSGYYKKKKREGFLSDLFDF